MKGWKNLDDEPKTSGQSIYICMTFLINFLIRNKYEKIANCNLEIHIYITLSNQINKNQTRPIKKPPPNTFVMAPENMLARFITMPSTPTSPLGATNGGACGPNPGWRKGHPHWPEHSVTKLPTQWVAQRKLWPGRRPVGRVAAHVEAFHCQRCEVGVLEGFPLLAALVEDLVTMCEPRQRRLWVSVEVLFHFPPGGYGIGVSCCCFWLLSPPVVRETTKSERMARGEAVKVPYHIRLTDMGSERRPPLW